MAKMNISRSVRCMMLISTLAPRLVAAQADDSRVKLLQDSVSALKQQISELSDKLETIALPNASIIGSSIVPLDDRAYVRVSTNRLGRLRVILKNQAGTFSQQVDEDDFKTDHVVKFSPLTANTSYIAEVIPLANTAAKAPLVALAQIGNPAAANYNPNLRFTTSAGVASPNVSVTALQVTSSSISATVVADQPSFFQLQVYEEDAAGNRKDPALKVDGNTLAVNEMGLPTEAMPKANATLSVAGLVPQKMYQYRVQAMNAQGKIGTVAPGYISIVTPAQPAAFGFNGPMSLTVDPTRGLVVKWKSTLKPDDAKVQTEYGPAAPNVTYPATIAGASGTDMEALIPTASLLQGPNQSPTITAMMRSGTETRTVALNFAMSLPQPGIISTIAGLSNDQKDSIRRVAEAVRNGNQKFRWSDLVMASLRTIGTILVP